MQIYSLTGRKYKMYIQHNKGIFYIAIAGSTVTSKSIAENQMTRVSTTPNQATVNATTNEGKDNRDIYAKSKQITK